MKEIINSLSPMCMLFMCIHNYVRLFRRRRYHLASGLRTSLAIACCSGQGVCYECCIRYCLYVLGTWLSAVQQVERWPCDQQVVGSYPTLGEAA